MASRIGKLNSLKTTRNLGVNTNAILYTSDGNLTGVNIDIVNQGSDPANVTVGVGTIFVERSGGVGVRTELIAGESDKLLTGVRIDALESLRISNVGVRSGDSVFVSCTKPDVSFLATGAVEYRDAISTLFGKGSAIKTGITTQNINRNLPILTASNPTKTTLYVSNANQSKDARITIGISSGTVEELLDSDYITYAKGIASNEAEIFDDIFLRSGQTLCVKSSIQDVNFLSLSVPADKDFAGVGDDSLYLNTNISALGIGSDGFGFFGNVFGDVAGNIATTSGISTLSHLQIGGSLGIATVIQSVGVITGITNITDTESQSGRSAGTFTIPGYTQAGAAGTAATFNVVVDATGAATQVSILDGGYGYTIGTSLFLPRLGYYEGNTDINVTIEGTGSLVGVNTALIVVGDARVTGILTIGTDSITIDGGHNTRIAVGGTSTLHSTRLEVGTSKVDETSLTAVSLNLSGVSTVSTVFVGAGVTLQSGLIHAERLSVNGISTFYGQNYTARLATQNYAADLTGPLHSTKIATFDDGISVTGVATFNQAVRLTADTPDVRAGVADTQRAASVQYVKNEAAESAAVAFFFGAL